MKKKKNKVGQGVFFRNILPSKKLSIQVEQRPRTLIIHCVSRASFDYLVCFVQCERGGGPVDRRENNMGVFRETMRKRGSEGKRESERTISHTLLTSKYELAFESFADINQTN